MHTAEGTVEGFSFFVHADYRVISISFVPKNLFLTQRQTIYYQSIATWQIAVD